MNLTSGLVRNAALGGFLQQDLVLDQPLLDHLAHIGGVSLALLGQFLDPGVFARLGDGLAVHDGDVLRQGQAAGQRQGRK